MNLLFNLLRIQFLEFNFLFPHFGMERTKKRIYLEVENSKTISWNLPNSSWISESSSLDSDTWIQYYFASVLNFQTRNQFLCIWTLEFENFLLDSLHCTGKYFLLWILHWFYWILFYEKWILELGARPAPRGQFPWGTTTTEIHTLLACLKMLSENERLKWIEIRGFH